jgi:hypothetical protein
MNIAAAGFVCRVYRSQSSHHNNLASVYRQHSAARPFAAANGRLTRVSVLFVAAAGSPDFAEWGRRRLLRRLHVPPQPMHTLGKSPGADLEDVCVLVARVCVVVVQCVHVLDQEQPGFCALRSQG